MFKNLNVYIRYISTHSIGGGEEELRLCNHHSYNDDKNPDDARHQDHDARHPIQGAILPHAHHRQAGIHEALHLLPA